MHEIWIRRIYDARFGVQHQNASSYDLDQTCYENGKGAYSIHNGVYILE